MKRVIMGAGFVLALIVGLFTLTVSTVSAHTPNHSATCSGVTASGTNYQTKQNDPIPNSWSIQIDTRVPRIGKFGHSFSQTIPVPQDAQTHTYTIHISAWDDPNNQNGFSPTYTGTVGPCGVQPPREDRFRDRVSNPNCDNHKVATKHQSSFRDYRYNPFTDQFEPTAWSPWVTDSVSVRHTTKQECPNVRVHHAFITFNKFNGCVPSRRAVEVASKHFVRSVKVHHGPQRSYWHIVARAEHGHPFVGGSNVRVKSIRLPKLGTCHPHHHGS